MYKALDALAQQGRHHRHLLRLAGDRDLLRQLHGPEISAAWGRIRAPKATTRPRKRDATAVSCYQCAPDRKPVTHVMKSYTAVVLVALFHCSVAMAWSRPGHMVTAAIAYEELRAQDPKLLEQIIALAERHPDRGAFEVAIGRARGEERGRRIFLELARWADDTRGSIHDHPTWHYSSRPLIDKASPPPKSRRDVPQGSAIEAFALNFSVASDSRAPQSERAVALCWVFHLVGDMHQPLHSVSQFSKRFPTGDRGGNFQYVRDPQTNEPMTLHWFWDDAVSREGEPDEVDATRGRLHAPLAASAIQRAETIQGCGRLLGLGCGKL